jgi:hypothetical protein
LLEKMPDIGLTATGSNHDIGAGVQHAHQECSLQIHLTIRTQEQNSPAMANTRLLKHTRFAHIPLHHLPDPFAQRITAPLRWIQIHGGERHIEGEQSLDARLSKCTEAADQHRSLTDLQGDSTSLFDTVETGP